ncbi:hypothetical protein MMC29_002531 [Sticta canariensis]|nr:hypothetical protein [Sticta canariensis]
MASYASLVSAFLLISSVPLTSAESAFFGKLKGNHQPTHTRPESAGVFAVGGQVDPPNAVTSINNQDGGACVDAYTQYCGPGGSSPPKSQWCSFEDMFNKNKPIMFSSCGQYNQPDDSGPEIGAIYDSIQQIATETKIDHRFILAVIMQESGGCVRVPTSNVQVPTPNGGVRNPGLMQDHDGDGTCNSDITHQVQNPCPTGVITQMIREGSAGTSSGDGLAQCINQSGSSGATAFYRAARLYNSGSIDSSGDLCKGIATHCYASDIANRLTGWTYAPHACGLDG